METFAHFHQIVRTRRSVRRWLPQPVPKEDLVRIVDCARLAPSDTNAQPWHFTIVTDRALIAALADATQHRFDAQCRELEARGRRETAKKLRVFTRYAAHFGSAPALVLISGEPYDSRFMREVFAEILTPDAFAHMAQEESVKSTALAAMNLLLGAHAMGYGAVAMTGPVLAIPAELASSLRVPEGFTPHLLIALGRPAPGELPAVARKPLETVTTWIE